MSKSTWLIQLASRTHYNVVGVALANKFARIAWAVLTTGESGDQRSTVVSIGL